MRLWLQTYANTAIAPSAALSVAAHLAIVGAAVYGANLSARAPDEQAATPVIYLPPPDRTPGAVDVAEHLQYIELGTGTLLPASTAGIGEPAGSPAARDALLGGPAGSAAIAQETPLAPLPAPDSVYSILNVEESAVRAEGSAAPVYPKEMLEQGIEGDVLARYVIDTTGRADSTSLVVVGATHPAFVKAVREALPAMRFVPASVQGHPVRQLVQQNFEFRIAAPLPAAAPAEHTRTHQTP